MTDRFDIQKIVQALQSVLPADHARVGLHEPSFTGNEWAYVKECLDTGWVSSVGKFVDRFETQLAEYTGAKRAVAVVNGTAALHMCLLLVGVKPGDEVIVPALTFVATANAVTYCGAIPHFADSEEKTLGLDPAKLEAYLNEIGDIRADGCYNKNTGRRIKAVVPMHTFGHAVDMDPLLTLAEHFRIDVIEDAAESLGSLYKGKHTGTLGRLAALSFNGNKTITTGGGGAILTNDEELGRLAKHLTTTARVQHQWSFVHDMVGYNYRLPNINAALGCAQMEQLPQFLKQKRTVAEHYETAFAGINGVKFFTESDFSRSNYWLNALVLDKNHSDSRDELLELANRVGITTRPAWTLMHRLPMFSTCPRMDLAVAEDLEQRLINIPSSACLGAPHATA